MVDAADRFSYGFDSTVKLFHALCFFSLAQCGMLRIRFRVWQRCGLSVGAGVLDRLCIDGHGHRTGLENPVRIGQRNHVVLHMCFFLGVFAATESFVGQGLLVVTQTFDRQGLLVVFQRFIVQ